MGEEFYCVIKLISGEEIFSLVSTDENDGDPIIILQNPVIMKVNKTPQGSIIRVKPWMDLPSDDFFILKLDKIITITEIKDKSIIKVYDRYLEEDETEIISDNYKSELTDKMGYISSVEDAREKLERIFKGIKEI